MAGIKDVAKRAGVSVSTVSNVLNNKKNVGEKTRELVLKICEEMNYSPNPAGKSLKSGKSNSILFNFSDFDRSFYLKIINGISDYLQDNDFDLIICTDKSCEKYMNRTLTCGSIILDKKMQDETLIRLAHENYPIVVLDRIINNPYIKSVVVNNYEPMYELIQGCIDRGYRRFGFVGGPEETADNKERYKAFKDALEVNNLEFQQKSYFAGNYREKSGYTAAKITKRCAPAQSARVSAAKLQRMPMKRMGLSLAAFTPAVSPWAALPRMREMQDWYARRMTRTLHGLRWP